MYELHLNLQAIFHQSGHGKSSIVKYYINKNELTKQIYSFFDQHTCFFNRILLSHVY